MHSTTSFTARPHKPTSLLRRRTTVILIIVFAFGVLYLMIAASYGPSDGTAGLHESADEIDEQNISEGERLQSDPSTDDPVSEEELAELDAVAPATGFEKELAELDAQENAEIKELLDELGRSR